MNGFSKMLMKVNCLAITYLLGIGLAWSAVPCSSIIGTPQQCSSTNHLPPPYGDGACVPICSFAMPAKAQTSTLGGAPVQDGSGTYNQYDSTCPVGYSLMGTRFVAGAPSLYFPTSISDLNSRVASGWICAGDSRYVIPLMVFNSPSNAGIIATGTLLEQFGIVGFVISATRAGSCFKLNTPPMCVCNSSGTRCEGGTLVSSTPCGDRLAGHQSCFAEPNAQAAGGSFLVYTGMMYMVSCVPPIQPNMATTNIPLQISMCGYKTSGFQGTAKTTDYNSYYSHCQGDGTKARDSAHFCPSSVSPMLMQTAPPNVNVSY